VFKWLKARRLENRIFQSQANKQQFILQCAFNKIEIYIRHISRLKQALMDNDKREINQRTKLLNGYGFNAPKTLQDCERLIEDIRQWRVM